MPVIKGDRIGESGRLNLRSPEAQDFYAHFVAVVPDDFRRFRLAPSLIASAMYPRREITPGVLNRVKRLLDQLGADPLPLWRTWVVDGVTFAELTTGNDRGNRYHRTPEPPWSLHGLNAETHRHNGACVPTAMARARDFGPREEFERLSLLMKEIRERKQGRTGSESRVGPGASRPSPSPPSPPSPRSNTIQQGSGAGGDTPSTGGADQGDEVDPARPPASPQVDIDGSPRPLTATTRPSPAHGEGGSETLPTADPVPLGTEDFSAYGMGAGTDSRTCEIAQVAGNGRPEVLAHDPRNPLEADLARRVAYLARRDAALGGAPVTRHDALEVLRSVSATDAGKFLDHVDRAPPDWITETSRVCRDEWGATDEALAQETLGATTPEEE